MQWRPGRTFLMVCLSLKFRATVDAKAKGGQRFVLDPDEPFIREERASPETMGRHSNPAMVDDLHFYRAWFDNVKVHGRDEYRWQLNNHSQISEWPSPTSLAVLMRKSIFCLSTTGRVYERFHNTVKWVYVRHENPSTLALVALTAVRNRGTYFASDAEGHLFQRLRVENGLGWMDVTSGAHRIFLSGVPSTDGNVFFVTADGFLLERHFDQTRSNIGGLWSNHKKPPNDAELISIANIVDAHTLRACSVWAIGADGNLYELIFMDENNKPIASSDSRAATTLGGRYPNSRWHHHGSPAGARLAPLPGVALKDANAVGSIFLRTEGGDLAERWWDAQSKAWQWIDHGHPDDGKVVSAPGALLNGVSIFVTVNAAAVTKNAPKERDHKVRGEGHSKSAAGADEAGPRSARFGVLYERWWSSVQSKWIWINHGNPPADGPILPVSPVDLHDGSVFCLLQNGKLAERVWNHNKWGWRTYDVPEGGSASYCSADPKSMNNCVQGYRVEKH